MEEVACTQVRTEESTDERKKIFSYQLMQYA